MSSDHVFMDGQGGPLSERDVGAVDEIGDDGLDEPVGGRESHAAPVHEERAHDVVVPR